MPQNIHGSVDLKVQLGRDIEDKSKIEAQIVEGLSLDEKLKQVFEILETEISVEESKPLIYLSNDSKQSEESINRYVLGSQNSDLFKLHSELMELAEEESIFRKRYYFTLAGYLQQKKVVHVTPNPYNPQVSELRRGFWTKKIKTEEERDAESRITKMLRVLSSTFRNARINTLPNENSNLDFYSSFTNEGFKNLFPLTKKERKKRLKEKSPLKNYGLGKRIQNLFAFMPMPVYTDVWHAYDIEQVEPFWLNNFSTGSGENVLTVAEVLPQIKADRAPFKNVLLSSLDLMASSRLALESLLLNNISEFTPERTYHFNKRFKDAEKRLRAAFITSPVALSTLDELVDERVFGKNGAVERSMFLFPSFQSDINPGNFADIEFDGSYGTKKLRNLTNIDPKAVSLSKDQETYHQKVNHLFKKINARDISSGPSAFADTFHSIMQTYYSFDVVQTSKNKSSFNLEMPVWYHHHSRTPSLEIDSEFEQTQEMAKLSQLCLHLGNATISYMFEHSSQIEENEQLFDEVLNEAEIFFEIVHEIAFLNTLDSDNVPDIYLDVKYEEVEMALEQLEIFENLKQWQKHLFYNDSEDIKSFPLTAEDFVKEYRRTHLGFVQDYRMADIVLDGNHYDPAEKTKILDWYLTCARDELGNAVDSSFVYAQDLADTIIGDGNVSEGIASSLEKISEVIPIIEQDSNVNISIPELLIEAYQNLESVTQTELQPIVGAISDTIAYLHLFNQNSQYQEGAKQLAQTMGGLYA